MSHHLLALSVWLQGIAARARDDRGQATAEYALVLLGAAALAMLLFAWAGSTNRITQLLDAVFRSVTSRVS
ncbi:MAG: DUF4244 domain-containing protein [Acidimicrobiales bacterium]|nr:DUF4244 domain-containing protein [Acidimicrobiales bacterium]